MNKAARTMPKTAMSDAIAQSGVAGVTRGVEPADRQPDPGVQLGRTAGVQHDVVHRPVVLDHRQSALGDDQNHGAVGSRGAQQPAEVARVRELLTTVDQHQICVGGLDQGTAFGRHDPHVVTEQGQAREHLRAGLEGAGEQQQRAQGVTSGSGARVVGA